MIRFVPDKDFMESDYDFPGSAQWRKGMLGVEGN